MTDHFQDIYANHVDEYEALVVREDFQGNLLHALQNITPLAGLDVVEFGAGTGRLTMMLAPRVSTIQVFDGWQQMLDVATAKLERSGLANWRTAVADNRAIPARDQSADLAIEGWSFGHLTGWYPDTWRDEVGTAVGEMQRVLRPGGTAVVIETLGTGREMPAPPSDGLGAFYEWLESEQDFSATWIRTDYRFESLAEAESLTRFFFGDELADEVVRNEWVTLPECTGIWWRRS